MRQYRIRGGNRLSGELAIGGAKNAVLPILSAVCLNESETIIYNCPRISDTFDSIEILKCIGFQTEFVGNTLKVNAGGEIKYNIPDKCAEKMRSSILFMGALLARSKRVNIALPGGCTIGERAIDLHVEGLKALGATIRNEGNKLFCETEGLKGAKIKLDFPSVGATENLMIAAVKAAGETTIENAAREPEIIDLARFLKKLGADIRGEGTPTVKIIGVDALCKTVSHSIIPDRIVAGTYLLAAAMTGGEITLSNICAEDLEPFAKYLREMGCKYTADNNRAYLRAPERLNAVPRIITEVHPGFPTDMQSQFAAALSTAYGKSEITETIFENRCKHVYELRKMNANIRMTANKETFIINGAERLRGANVSAHDLRCGAALILAALSADGESVVRNAHYVERGYANIEKDLSALGADIELEDVGELDKCA